MCAPTAAQAPTATQQVCPLQHARRRALQGRMGRPVVWHRLHAAGRVQPGTFVLLDPPTPQHPCVRRVSTARVAWACARPAARVCTGLPPLWRRPLARHRVLWGRMARQQVCRVRGAVATAVQDTLVWQGRQAPRQRYVPLAGTVSAVPGCVVCVLQARTARQ